MKGMTPKEPSDREVEASQYSMTLEGFDRVCGAARVIATTRGKQRRYSNLVPTNKQNEERAHRSACDSSCPATNLSNVGIQLTKRRSIGLGFRPDQEIDATKVRQQGCSHQLAQPTFDAVSLYDLMSMFGYHNADPWMQKQGS